MNTRNVSFHEQYLADFNLVERCLQGDSEALSKLQQVYREPVTALLMKRGATGVEAGETVTMLWGDLLTPTSSGRSPLSRYNGTCALLTYLNTVAINALLTRKRTDGRRANRFPSSETGEFAEPCGADVLREEPVIELVREALDFAFATCHAEHFVILHLLFFGGLKRPEVERMFLYDKSKMQREVTRARIAMRESTMEFVRQRDPWLELRWEDFLELCQTVTLSSLGLDE